ncbi:Protein mago nashi-like protein, partial [Cucurbita argyrosperma subsp. argyrosperma]
MSGEDWRMEFYFEIYVGHKGKFDTNSWSSNSDPMASFATLTHSNYKNDTMIARKSTSPLLFSGSASNHLRQREHLSIEGQELLELEALTDGFLRSAVPQINID